MGAEPNDYILNFSDVQKRVSLSRSQVWRLEKTGAFPSRVSISSRRVGWRASDISAWIANRASVSRNEGARHE